MNINKGSIMNTLGIILGALGVTLLIGYFVYSLTKEGVTILPSIEATKISEPAVAGEAPVWESVAPKKKESEAKATVAPAEDAVVEELDNQEEKEDTTNNSGNAQ